MIFIGKETPTLTNVLSEAAETNEDNPVLDIACGYHNYLFSLAKMNKQVTGIIIIDMKKSTRFFNGKKCKLYSHAIHRFLYLYQIVLNGACMRNLSLILRALETQGPLTVYTFVKYLNT